MKGGIRGRWGVMSVEEKSSSWRGLLQLRAQPEISRESETEVVLGVWKIQAAVEAQALGFSSSKSGG